MKDRSRSGHKVEPVKVVGNKCTSRELQELVTFWSLFWSDSRTSGRGTDLPLSTQRRCHSTGRYLKGDSLKTKDQGRSWYNDTIRAFQSHKMKWKGTAVHHCMKVHHKMIIATCFLWFSLILWPKMSSELKARRNLIMLRAGMLLDLMTSCRPKVIVKRLAVGKGDVCSLFWSMTPVVQQACRSIVRCH